jgi:hypothetical protein
MYISNMTHFLDDQGNIPKQMPKEARELASFLALVVDVTTKTMPLTLSETGIRCFNKGCHGQIKSSVNRAKAEIHWQCHVCGNEGVISNWGKTKWDNTKSKRT